MMVTWVVGLALVATVTALTALPSSGTRPRLGWLLVGLCALIPFTIPEDPQWIRLLVASFAVVFAARSWERTHGRAPPDITESAARFVLWWLVPAEARYPKDATDALRARREGRRRLLRVLPKLGAIMVLALINRALDDITANRWVFAAWSMGLIYAMISAIADGLTGVLMQTGVHLTETFDAPILARSPRDFWGRRWNLFVHRWAIRNVFFPLGGVRAIGRTTLLVFAVSGLMHEYLLIACADGVTSRVGHTVGFFLLQGAGVLAESRVRRKLPRSMAVLLHLAFLLVTTPIFFRPLDAAVGYSRWWKPASTAVGSAVPDDR
jgi:hypothetical protein